MWRCMEGTYVELCIEMNGIRDQGIASQTFEGGLFLQERVYSYPKGEEVRPS